MTRSIFLAAWLCAAVAPAGEPNVRTGGAQESAAGKVVCQIRQHTGRPTVFINGSPRFPMAFASYFPEPYRYRQFGEHGVHVHFVCLTLSDKWINWSVRRVSHHTPGIWKGPNDLDFSIVDNSLREVLAADPQAHIIPRVYCESPSWWDARHCEDVRSVAAGAPLRQSFSSSAWRAETTAVLKRLVRHVSSAEYGNRVIGYMPTAGDTEELADTASDLSPCAERAFREWLGAKYGNEEPAIVRLFGGGLQRICIPPIARRHTPKAPVVGLTAGDCGNFLDPQKSRLVIDYRQFESEKMADTAIALCRAVKEESGGRLITGVFYGYTRIFPDTGHLAMRRVLDSGAIDFLSTPYSSSGVKQRLSIGYSDFQNPTQVASLQKAGRIFYCEADIRTTLSRWISQSRPEIDPDGEYNIKDVWWGPPTIEDSLHVLKMVFARVLVSGAANWWFDLWGGWYDHKDILDLFARMQKVGDESLHVSRKSVAQIALVLDENAYRYLPFSVSEHGGRFRWVAGQLGQFGRIGAPYDAYLLDDLNDLDLSQYRMIVFLNAFVLSEEQRRMICRRCMSGNRLLVWMYAPGLIKDDRLSVEHVSSLLGVKCQMEAARPETQVSLDPPFGPATYKGAAVSPFISVQQGADAARGRTPDGRIVVAEKASSNCRNLFVALPPLPWNVLQHYAKTAGVHLYAEGGDVILANEHYLAVAAGTAGKRTIRLPRKAALKEVLAFGDAESLAEHTQFELDMPANTCRIFQW